MDKLGNSVIFFVATVLAVAAAIVTTDSPASRSSVQPGTSIPNVIRNSNRNNTGNVDGVTNDTSASTSANIDININSNNIGGFGIKQRRRKDQEETSNTRTMLCGNNDAVDSGNTGAATRRDEPSFFVKQRRRITVFRMAIQIYIEYQFAKRKAKRMQRNLQLTDAQAEDHPDIIQFWSHVNRKVAQRLTGQIKALEGFWVKVGQYLSSRADVMPLEYIQELSALQDSMPERNFEKDIMTTLREELTPAQFEALESIDPNSLSTASLAQVHRAKLTNGQDVVIKVQHRGVASLMRQDIENLRVIMKVLARFEPDFDYEPVVKEYSTEVEKELDFRTEAVNMNEVRLLLAENKVDAIVPRAIPDLVTERVLVMEFCHGFAVRDLKAMDEHNVDRRLLLERICAAWAVQMHVGGVFNADPHYGNILVSTAPGKDSSVPVLLDFGLTKRLDDNMKVAFSRLMHASDVGDVDEMLRSFDEMGLKMNDHDPFEDMASMQRSFKETVPQTEAKEVQKQRSQDYRARVDAMKKDQGLGEKQKLRNPVEAWPSELVFFGRVSGLLRGLCSYLDVKYPYLNTMANAARVTICETVPIDDQAKSLVHRESSITDVTLREKLESAIGDMQKQGNMVGLQLNVRVAGEELINVAAGVLGSANPRPVTPSTLFNIFSVGKAYLTIGILRLVQDGKVRLDEPVATYWPEFGKKDITVRHVLSHQSGLANAMPREGTLDTMLDWNGMKKFMETTDAEHPAGQQTKYHYLSFAWLCGGIIEAVTKQPYDQYLKSILTQSDGDDVLHLHTGGLPEEIESDALAVLSIVRSDLEGSMDAAAEAAKREKMEKMKQLKAKQEAQSKEIESVESKDDKKEGEEHKQVLQKYKGREQLMNPSVFNMRKVRDAKLPSANMHASASSLAKVMDDIITKEHALTTDTIAMAQKQQGEVQGAENALLDDSSAFFGLGFQVHEFEHEGRKVFSFGHAGLGGSLVICIPDAKLSVAFTTNQLSQNPATRNTLLKIVFEEFNLKAPDSVLR